ncbi:MAG: universal stress protein [Antricoccus sp.]
MAHPRYMEDDNAPAQILVGVDGSDSSIEALRAAARIATAMDARIKAVMTWEYPAKFYTTPGLSPETDARNMLSDAVARAFGTDLPAGMDSAALYGPPARVLIEQSATADLLVLGSRGHGGFTGLLLGSVSTAVSQHAQCPVLITHHAERSKITGRAHGSKATI